MYPIKPIMDEQDLGLFPWDKTVSNLQREIDSHERAIARMQEDIEGRRHTIEILRKMQKETGDRDRQKLLERRYQTTMAESLGRSYVR